MLVMTMINVGEKRLRNHIEVSQVNLALLLYPCFMIRNPCHLHAKLKISTAIRLSARTFSNFGKLLLVPYIKDFGRITQF